MKRFIKREIESGRLERTDDRVAKASFARKRVEQGRICQYMRTAADKLRAKFDPETTVPEDRKNPITDGLVREYGFPSEGFSGTRAPFLQVDFGDAFSRYVRLPRQ